MFARKLARLAGLVLVLTVAFGASTGAAGESVAQSRDLGSTFTTLHYDWD